MSWRCEICGVSGVTAALLMLTAAGFGQQVVAAGCDQASGRRVEGYRWDTVLRQRWAVRSSCGHPERPQFAEAVAGSEALAAQVIEATRPVVRPGDAVRVRMSTGCVRMELAAVAEENGFTGKKIRVRLEHVSDDPSGVQQRMVAVVRGPGAVEVLP